MAKKKKRRNSAIDNDMDESQCWAKQEKHKRLYTMWFTLYKMQAEAHINYNI